MKKYRFLALVIATAALWGLLYAPAELQYFALACAASTALGAVFMRIIGWLDGWC